MKNEQSSKNFTYFDQDLSTEEKHMYIWFETLNSLLEQHDWNYDKLYESYLRVLWGDVEKSNMMDMEINNLMNVEKVLVNKILDFGKLKYHPRPKKVPSLFEGFDMLIMR